MNQESSRKVRILVVAAITIAALGLRWHAANVLRVDYDEPVYLEAAQRMAETVRTGRLAELLDEKENPEHPQLAKLLFALAILPAPDSAPSEARGSVWVGGSRQPEAQLLFARRAAAFLGALGVLLLSVIQPLAGLLLAVHTYTLKYTSLVMLEALPALTSLGAFASYVRYKHSRSNRFLILSSVLLGLSAAGKFIYAVVGVAILIDWMLVALESRGARRRCVRNAFFWGVGSLLVFAAAYPYLWPDPIERLSWSIRFHASGGVVTETFPFWQPLAWLTVLVQADVPERRPYLVQIDPLISVLAVFGVHRLWKRERSWVIWLMTGLLFLLVWPSRLPQYLLILSAPLCLAAAEGIAAITSFARGRAPAPEEPVFERDRTSRRSVRRITTAPCSALPLGGPSCLSGKPRRSLNFLPAALPTLGSVGLGLLPAGSGAGAPDIPADSHRLVARRVQLPLRTLYAAESRRRGVASRRGATMPAPLIRCRMRRAPDADQPSAVAFSVSEARPSLLKRSSAVWISPPPRAMSSRHRAFAPALR
jgi:hypothetical protein